MKKEQQLCLFFDLLLSIEKDGQLHISLCDKRYDFNFYYITNF